MGLTGGLSTHAQSVTTIYSFPNGASYPTFRLTLGPDGNFYSTTTSGGNTSLSWEDYHQMSLRD